ncbi:type I glyceraldehyde-3-phosphate dehydrogenase [Candidatus Nomurabacteria bacterium RIFCSPLOWO2_02_40_28]|uniref:Glyceraldehyde-3-phosphate dehydrogenase, type I n=2 Tax=Candidatus Nomuraibacteriota TaxID=1752729 RepID=A0A837HRL4_9BACT|nr:MAG: Glyceraldehyde-3-phosphate dehydrogenase, type I [Candidatus Nomurabacteria bacterium GW2011_GWD2_39_12]KKR20278.1 MAG: Glyceraldehyde-3-phosphate dehydrogenase, type I [Candidatus Nomurabacteria bacterium GW2011_GWC2_39_41]KKR36524.1 MAG: Glyceraldehyde-3-phosphate dehydrogenase, type I [Candidatus Nomurabacteria bacterium GW2011_GWE2_40_10]KKR38371.1 MAG: Glyceraldehyde-3-phosphate dehydrogenase, type I [Candidatus Nomurabacteria bacterium GW2011_GWB1_40_11]KKR39870.1 MAG: Glyceraldeh
MKKIKVGINGFGRIGRAFLKVAWERPEIEIVAVNDLGSVENMAYLLKYDTVYKKWEHDIKVEGQDVIIDGKKIKVLAEKDPSKLPWKDLGVDVVVESTGLFTSYEKAKVHLDAGAKKVVITAPAKGSDGSVVGETILLGVNEEKFGTCDITSNASCTTNAASPLIAILDETLGIEKAILNTVHGYTASQALVDGPSKKDLREGRAAAQNIVPSSTGAAIAVTKAFTKLSGLFDGISIRVPVPAGSIVDITFISKKNTTAEEVNSILKKASQEKRWENLFSATEEELVSSDILGSHYGSIADLKMTRVVDGNLVKVMGWYDNEMGYTYTLVDHVIKTGNTIK